MINIWHDISPDRITPRNLWLWLKFQKEVRKSMNWIKRQA